MILKFSSLLKVCVSTIFWISSFWASTYRKLNPETKGRQRGTSSKTVVRDQKTHWKSGDSPACHNAADDPQELSMVSSGKWTKASKLLAPWERCPTGEDLRNLESAGRLHHPGMVVVVVQERAQGWWQVYAFIWFAKAGKIPQVVALAVVSFKVQLWWNHNQHCFQLD